MFHFWCAPLEGVTDAIYRRIHADMFPGVEKYYIPFVSPSKHLCFTSREQRELSPAENNGVHAIPQILTKDAEQFLWMANSLADIGYDEINLNLGCPSGTVTAKGKGSGLLRDLQALQRLLDAIFEASPIPISIKTRIGYDSIEEWPRLLNILRVYPTTALIVHPRTRSEFYRGQPHWSCLTGVTDNLNVVGNGNLFSLSDLVDVHRELPSMQTFMIGRGLIANPALIRELNGGEVLQLRELYAFHQRLLNGYCAAWPPQAVLGHMREITRYMLQCLDDPHAWRGLRKVRTVQEYEAAVDRIFSKAQLTLEHSFSGRL